MRRRHWLRRLLLGAAVLALLWLAVGSWIASSALHRVLTVGTIAGAIAGTTPPDDPFDLGYVGDPRVTFGMDFEDVVVPTPLGDAPAWLVPAENGPNGLWAIYVHGIAGDREDGYRHLSVLHEAGIPTLLVTYRNDAGAPAGADGVYTFGLTEWPDIEAAVDLALARGATRILLVGESMGGAISGAFLRNSTRADRVVGLVLDAPALDMPAVTASGLKGLRVPTPLTIGRISLWLFAQRYGVDFTRAVTLDTVAEFPGPLFLAHGDGDRIVPVSISDRLMAERTGVTTYLRTRADHLQSWHEDPDRYRGQLLLYLSQF